MTIATLHNIFLKHKNVCTDTRKIKTGDLFFALKGENFNGNHFAKKALELGASYAVIDEKPEVNDDKFILVDDALQTLQQLATYHRKFLGITAIALTGSNGKTTTKELIHAVLSMRYTCQATEGNLNNHIGVPLTLLALKAQTEIAVVEMGANHQKEIAFLTNIAFPDYGLITNFGKAHLEGFGGVEGVIKGKSEMYDHLRKHQKYVFINTDDPKQLQQIGDYDKTIRFGSDTDNDCVIEFLDATPFVTMKYDDNIIRSQLIGAYNFGNIAIAVAIGQYFKIPTAQIKIAIEAYHPSNNRSELKELGSNTIILDAYNANPTSMLAALQHFKQLDTTNKYLFIGDMFELGEDAALEHQRIVDYLDAHFDGNIYLLGENFYQTKTSPKMTSFKRFEDIIPVLEAKDIQNATLFIKGSRGMALERILEYL